MADLWNYDDNVVNLCDDDDEGAYVQCYVLMDTFCALKAGTKAHE